jgi:cell division septum initiation protein DivIVA
MVEYNNYILYTSFKFREITKLENKLKVLKQELANKIEIAQSSYVAIQKTLTEISKLVNNQVKF